MQARLVNCTKHDIIIDITGHGSRVIQPSGFVPRVAQEQGVRDEGASSSTGVPVFSADTMGEVVGMPIVQRGVWYVVSGMVGAALKGRRFDILVPGTGPNDAPVREGGRIVAVTRLKRV